MRLKLKLKNNKENMRDFPFILMLGLILKKDK